MKKLTEPDYTNEPKKIEDVIAEERPKSVVFVACSQRSADCKNVYGLIERVVKSAEAARAEVTVLPLDLFSEHGRRVVETPESFEAIFGKYDLAIVGQTCPCCETNSVVDALKVLCEVTKGKTYLTTDNKEKLVNPACHGLDGLDGYDLSDLFVR